MEKYALSNLIGEGSFGKVYKAIDKSSKITVALKIINKRGRNGREIKGLRGECEIQRNLQHPNIIRMVDSFETENEIAVVTEYAKTDLHSLLRDGSLGESRTQRITFDLVSALYYLHSHRILHRDLKPQNILLDRNMCAKLCDFGFARNMTMGTHVLTSIKGTPLYMAPELLEAKPYDHHADLWSLGCIIYEMLAGEPPFSSMSMIHLMRLIRNQYIKWPSYATTGCISFVKGLLQRDPSQRLNWNGILAHCFVRGHITVIKENVPSSPFTNPNEASKYNENNNPGKLIWGSSETTEPVLCDEDLTTSKDSMNVILHSDIEYQETDTDDCTRKFLSQVAAEGLNISKRDVTLCDSVKCSANSPNNLVQLTEYPNLVVTHFNDNFPSVWHRLTMVLPMSNNSAACASLEKTYVSSDGIKTQNLLNLNLDRLKLSLSLSNFPTRMDSDKQMHDRIPHKTSIVAEILSRNSEEKKHKNIPSLLPGWDSCDASQNPPIENEEWLAFLHRSMQEVLDGDLDALKHQNFVCIIVAPLRNFRASTKVIENVAHLLSLPLALDTPPFILHDIVSVYRELKLVPNLVYASKLLCNKAYVSEYNSGSYSSNMNESDGYNIPQLSTLENDDVRTLTIVYDLICHLVHIGDIFLNQFCDAIEILGIKELFVSFLNIVNINNSYVQLVSSLIALMNCALREFPENAEIVEQIVFHEQVNLKALLKHRDALLRHRTCMLIRILARFSCLALEKRWTSDIKECFESLLVDCDMEIQKEARLAIDEFKYLSFVTNKSP